MKQEATGKDTNIEIPVVAGALAGQKRTYVDANQPESNSEAKGGAGTKEQSVQLRGLQDIIQGLESQKRRRRLE